MIETILLDNPEIDEAVLNYCEAQPEYQLLEAACKEKYKELQRFFLELEDAYNAKWGFLTQAYYHIGLGVRQELLTALNPTAPNAAWPICPRT